METKTAPLGATVLMDCRTDLEPPVSYQWSKPGGVLPRDININSVSKVNLNYFSSFTSVFGKTVNNSCYTLYTFLSYDFCFSMTA